MISLLHLAGVWSHDNIWGKEVLANTVTFVGIPVQDMTDNKNYGSLNLNWRLEDYKKTNSRGQFQLREP